MTFTTKTGQQYEVSPANTWTALNGTTVTDHRVNVYDPKSGHGWSGVMTAQQLAAVRPA